MYGYFGTSVYGASDTTIDVVDITGKTAIAGGGTAATLAVAAGGAAAVPVVGWVVAAGIGTAAGTFALVDAIKRGKVRRAEAVKLARRLGIPNPENAPTYLVKVMKWDKAKRRKELAKLREKLKKQRKRGKGWWESAANQRQDIRDLRWKINVLNTLGQALGEGRRGRPARRGRPGRRQQIRPTPFGFKSAAGMPPASAYAPRPVGVSMPPTRPVPVTMPQTRGIPVVSDAEMQAEATEAVDTALVEKAEAEEKGGFPTWGWVALGLGAVGAYLYINRDKRGKKSE